MKTLAVLVSLTSDGNDYQRAQAAAASEAAERHSIQVRILFAAGDPLVQIEHLLQAICSRAPRFDAIICHPAGGTALPGIARAAAAAHIAWVVLHPEAEYVPELRRNSDVPVFAVCADQQAIGRCQGQQIAELLPEGGSVLCIYGPGISRPAQVRAAGMHEACPNNVQVLGLRGMGWDEQNGYETVAKWLQLSTSHRQRIDMVVGQNDLLALGARRSFQEHTAGAERERWLSLPFLGVDGLPGGGCKWVNSGILAATVVVPLTATVALDLLVASLQSGRQPPEITSLTPRSWPDVSLLAKSRRTRGQTTSGA